MIEKCTRCDSPFVVQDGFCARCCFRQVAGSETSPSSDHTACRIPSKSYKIGVGMRIGWWQASLPLVELFIQESTLTLFIQLPWRKFVFSHEEIEVIRAGSRFIYQELFIVHRNSHYPNSLSVWVKYTDLPSLHNALTSAGFTIDFPTEFR